MERLVRTGIPLAITIALLAGLPFLAQARPFGGSISFVKPCYNETIYSTVGPPRGGQMIWYPGTKTYQYGPPSHAGQWLLGIAGPPYYCLAYIQPITIWPGERIIMMGSSQ